MSVVYLNGAYMPQEEARISIFDRSVLFGDAVYDVTNVMGGRMVAFDRHCARLFSSLEKLGIKKTVGRKELIELHRELIERNSLVNGYVYVQVTRGAAKNRSFDFPDPEQVKPNIFGLVEHQTAPHKDPRANGIRVVSVPELRWGRRDIKTVQLLYASMALRIAEESGADDAWMVQEDGRVTEGTNHNAFIVSGGTIITRELSHALLPGTMRAAALGFAQENSMHLEERAFSIEEARKATEAFVTSSGYFVTPVIEIDGIKIGDGQPGPIAVKLRELMFHGLTYS